MRLYRKIIPKLSKEIIATLKSDGDVEIDDQKLEEAELDVAAILVEYCNAEDRLNQETRETLSRRGLSPDRFAQVKKTLAEARKHKTGEEGLEHVINQMIEGLMHSRNVEEVFAEDHEMRKKIHNVIVKYLGIDEEIDREVRSRLKNLREGTPDWDVEYERLVGQAKRSRGLAS
ncbi:MAG: DUF507 family protein [Deltaproteobacteria bacterium]|nr:DUF507 family protein [Deltaproteobacteria bacterium]